MTKPVICSSPSRKKIRKTTDLVCPHFVFCRSEGSLNGKDLSHHILGLCPIYHNTTTEACRKRKQVIKSCCAKNVTADKSKNIYEDYPLLLKLQEKYKCSKYDPNTINENIDSQNNLSYSLQHVLPDIRQIVPDLDLELFMITQCVTVNMHPQFTNSFRQDGPRISEFCGKKESKMPLEMASPTSDSDSSAFEKNMINKCSKNGFHIECLQFGNFDIAIWYSSPFPREYVIQPKLYMCEFCLKYYKSDMTMKRHVAKCLWKHPPGTEIYRKDNLSFFEIDGEKNKIFCQNLCLLGKMFLDSKTLYYDVEPFLFYLATINDADGCHMVGYFSKEKISALNYNLSCILVIPPFMKKGYGQMLIDFSYLLSKNEGKLGSPERPLSDLGLFAYRKYWLHKIDEYFGNECQKVRNISIKEMSIETCINTNDLVSTMQFYGRIKYWKGKHIILKSTEKMTNCRCVDKKCLSWNPDTSLQ